MKNLSLTIHPREVPNPKHKLSFLFIFIFGQRRSCAKCQNTSHEAIGSAWEISDQHTYIENIK